MVCLLDPLSYAQSGVTTFMTNPERTIGKQFNDFIFSIHLHDTSNHLFTNLGNLENYLLVLLILIMTVIQTKQDHSKIIGCAMSRKSTVLTP